MFKLKIKLIIAIITIVGITTFFMGYEKTSKVNTESITEIDTTNKSISNSPVICNSNGELLIKEQIFLDGFNSVFEEKATKLAFCYSEKNDEHSLLFHLEKGGGVAFPLTNSNKHDYYVIKNSTKEAGGASGKTHTCAGDPCNSCDISSSWFTTVKCTCNQNDCPTCKCNHTVTITRGKYSTSKLIIGINKNIASQNK